jgi:uroporphyrin-III C-methyltransferase
MGKTPEPDMTDDQPKQEHNTPEPDNTPPAEKPAGKPPSRAGSSLARVSIMQMTLLAILALFIWQWFDSHRQINDLQQEMARRLSEMDGNNQAGMALVKQEQESMRELSTKVAMLETQNAEMQNQRAALSTLYRDLSGSRDDMVLVDVEQILMIADQQLQLSANVKAALIAMQQADDRLKGMNRAALSGVRKVIGHDMEKLRALPSVDVAGISNQIDDLIDSVDDMPLTQELRLKQEKNDAASGAPSIGETAWQRFWREIWEEARHLVLIENTQKRTLPLLSPSETFFLRENLKLELLSARLALLSRDDASFRHDLRITQDWLQRYFDAKSPASVKAMATLRKLRTSSINIKLPDISDSLVAVRNYRASLAKGAQ